VDVQTFVIVFVRFLVMALWLVILGRVLMSWVDPTFSRPIARFLYEATEPILAPIRRVLPQTGMFDFSPLIVLLTLGVILRLLW
jgi:YggT family protein